MKKFKICIIIVLALAFSATVGYMVFGTDEPKVSNYRIKAEGKEDGICCVKVSGMKNKLIQGRLNSLIQKEWMLWLKDYLDKCPSAYEESVGGYIISDRFLCLTNRLDSVVNGIGEPDYYAVYDLKTGKQVYLDDLFELNDDFIYALQQYGKAWQYDTGESMRRISGFEDDSVEEIRDYLERIVMTQTDYNKVIEGTDIESYYKSDYVISGDYLYLRVRIPLDKLEEFLKVPKWWKSKPGLGNADLETVNSEIKKYLDMTNQEVRDLTGKDQDRYRDTFVFQTNVLFPCIRPENLPFYFICGDYWDDDAPMYLAFYEKAEEEYLELLGINKDMGFHDIIEVMGTEPVVWDWAEGVSDFDRERYKIELEKYGLRYIFCSDNAEGYEFSMFIEKTSQYLTGHGLSADRQKQILNLIGEWMLSACHAEYQEDSPKYVYLEGEMHEILEENIASGSPYSVYDNAALCEALKETLEDGEWIAETCDSFFVAEYFVFDFNGDGEEDYLVSLAGAGYHGSGGNSVSIFLGGDVLQEVFGATVRFYGGIYAPVMVLNEKTGGLYNIAFDGYDVIWKYDEQEEWYHISP